MTNSIIYNENGSQILRNDGNNGRMTKEELTKFIFLMHKKGVLTDNDLKYIGNRIKVKFGIGYTDIPDIMKNPDNWR